MKEMYFDYYYIVYEYNTVYIYVLLSQNNEEILRNARKARRKFWSMGGPIFRWGTLRIFGIGVGQVHSGQPCLSP